MRRTVIAVTIAVALTSSGCAFAFTKAEVERKLTLVVGATDDTVYSQGLEEVVAVGPKMIPVLLEIVQENQDAAIAYDGNRTEENRRRMALMEDAISALGRLLKSADDAALIVPVLEAIAANRDVFVMTRETAIAALARGGAPGGVEALTRLLNAFTESRDKLRIRVVYKLAETPDSRGRDVLKEIGALDDPHVQARLEARRHVAPLSTKGPDAPKSRGSCAAVPLFPDLFHVGLVLFLIGPHRLLRVLRTRPRCARDGDRRSLKSE